jgi:hypothetical protein
VRYLLAVLVTANHAEFARAPGLTWEDWGVPEIAHRRPAVPRQGPALQRWPRRRVAHRLFEGGFRASDTLRQHRVGGISIAIACT